MTLSTTIQPLIQVVYLALCTGAFNFHAAGVIGPFALRISVQSLSQADFAGVHVQRWMYGVLVARCVVRPGALASSRSLAALARPGSGLKVKECR